LTQSLASQPQNIHNLQRARPLDSSGPLANLDALSGPYSLARRIGPLVRLSHILSLRLL